MSVHYNHYKKTLKLNNGELTSAAVDDELALSFVFKRCSLHLLRAAPDGKAPQGKTDIEAGRVMERAAPPAPPSPPNAGGEEEQADEEGGCLPTVFCGLLEGEVLWVQVEEDAAESAAADARQAAFAARRATASASGEGGDCADIKKEKVEGCSCIWGNPCESAYGCEDWGGRFALARKHGWKG